MSIWTLAAKDLRLLMRDPRAGIILLVMPLVFILVLGLALGEGFFSKPDDRLRVSIVNLDTGLPPEPGPFPGRPWSEVFIEDLSTTAGVRVELIPSREEAEELIQRGERPAVLILGPNFSRRMHRSSFLTDSVLPQPGINPFFRGGVDLSILDVEVLRDPTQTIGAAIIEQVAQVSMLRILLPWMIGAGFEKVGETIPFARIPIQRLFSKYDLTAKTWAALTRARQPAPTYVNSFAVSPHAGLAGIPWAGLWYSQLTPPQAPAALTKYEDRSGTGFLRRGAQRYQILVPSYTVTFAFFMVLTTGWLFVAERREGTLTRLRAAPLSRSQILIGKFLPCLAVALFQGYFLIAGGTVIFGMDWGPKPLWLIPVVACTAFAAMGLALLVASVARTETQVAIYGTLLVLILAGVSGSLMPRELMPEQMKEISRFTPHAWALDAYNQLLVVPSPDLMFVGQACLVLLGFGMGFLALAWWLIRLD